LAPPSPELPTESLDDARLLADQPLADQPLADHPLPRVRRSKGLIATVVLLSVALAAALGAIVYFYLQLEEASELIEDQNQQLEEQHDLIEKKETFGAAMTGLLQVAAEFDGVLMSTLVPYDDYDALAQLAWAHRWNPTALDRDTASAESASRDLEGLLENARAQAETNQTRTTYEKVIDTLGAGFVTTQISDTRKICDDDVLACVTSDDPFTVHVDADEGSAEYLTDWLRTGVAYHEYAHVLQFTNPDATEMALESFDGDPETMADCFALTYLPGWTLDHRIWVNSWQYWDVSIGYGHTCTAKQKQVVRDWYNELGVQHRVVSQ
jgi:hypothetical protein